MTGVRRRVAALAAAAVLGLLPPAASADPWKDESGHGRGRGDRWEGDWRGECRGRGCDYDDVDYGYGHPGGIEGLIRCNRDVIGGVLGGAAGGVLGSRVGDKDYRTATTIGGAIIGVLLGGALGRSMDRRDQACIGYALEYGGSDEPIRWRDPEGVLYEVVPSRPYRIDDGRYCREYELFTGEGRRAVDDTACRRPDGAWVAAVD